jgi:DUF438 domain-containing protein
MEKVPRIGKMEQNTLVTGEMVWLKEKVYSIMLMGMSTPVNFTKIEQMDSESMFIQMVKSMKDFGKMTCKMGQEKKS